jgi:hypothetical protein
MHRPVRILGLVAVVACFALAAGAADAPKPKAEYVGSNKCKTCHIKQHKAWAETGHAKAFTKLETMDAQAAAEMAAKIKVELAGAAHKTDACVTCHVTGFQAGGFPAADSTKNANLAAVGCEACHGPGSAHVALKPAERKTEAAKTTIKTTMTAEDCQKCHTADFTPKFDLDAMKAKGVHAVAAAAAPAK